MELKKFYDAANAAEARVQTIASEINGLFDAGKTEEALAKRPELDKAKAEAKSAQQLYLSMQAATAGDGDPGSRFVRTNGDPEPKEVAEMRASKEYARQFWGAFQNGASPKLIRAGMHSGAAFPLLLNALTETGGSPAGSEGGFLLPVDFDNRIHELMRQFIDLAVPSYFNVEEVTSYSGWRAIEVATAALPFAKLTESDDLPLGESPTFTKVEYTVEDYGGYLPVANDLLADTPANVMTYLARWFSKKVVLTNNSLLLAIVNALSATTLSASDDPIAKIKTALNKTLDPDIAAGANIFTNQTGYDLLDQAIDGDGRPMLQPDPTQTGRKVLHGRPVLMLADRQWANITSPSNLARIAVGSPEVATLFRRAAFEMASTTIGGAAWRKNQTEVRGIMRAVAKPVDSSAMVLFKVPFN